MTLRKVTISELTTFVESGEYLKYGILPITPLRAISQANNPKANPDDVVLTLSFGDDGQLEGFIGALPDNIRNEHCAWNSCWWVKPGCSAETSLKLFLSFLTDWNKKVLFSELTPHTSSLIEKLKFCNHQTITGLRGYIRFCLADILPRKKSWTKKIIWLLRITDTIANIFVPLIFASNPVTKAIHIEAIDFPEENDNAFIEKHNTLQPAKRYSEDYKWIKKFNWIETVQKGTGNTPANYPFSYRTKRFEMQWLRFSYENRTVALAAYTLRDKELKLPCIYTEKEYIPQIGDYFYNKLLKDKSLCSATTFDPDLANYFLTKKKFIFRTRLPKYTAIAKALSETASIEHFTMQMGDGDAIFT
ncbi:MAG TPA: hypothetical protein PKV50_00795 [Prolixibacteraceae bacterium]|nr:hypothetical protein [Bacteroidales bacterium]HPB04816.1 hypothetical protein [Prolixibacteraceae bacterium]HQN92812.1 hypothetical protein [Prolixibacteraceae bacterium]HUM88036.1 hypothetical protein [Prolixibacteraceae bacterium]